MMLFQMYYDKFVKFLAFVEEIRLEIIIYNGKWWWEVL